MKITAQDGAARRGYFETPHGTVQTPVFMNVATCGAIKGAVASEELPGLHCDVQLCNTYHLHVRPGDDTVRALGGLHTFTGWNGPILTDSGGFQVFSLAKLRKIREEGVAFQSHVDGRALFIGPEESMQIQSHLGSDIAMAFDECVENPAKYDYARASCERTVRWFQRCRAEHERLNALPDTVNPGQLLFAINQGSTYGDLRVENMKALTAIGADGYAIGGLAVGESAEEMYTVIDQVVPLMPEDKPRYLMGVGTPVNILEAVYRGVDMFDCVMPARNARHGHVFTWSGRRNMLNQKYALDEAPLDEQCDCPACQAHSRAYIHHLFKAGEMLAMRLCVMHNLHFYNTLMRRIRQAIEEGNYREFYEQYTPILDKRI